MQHSENTEIVNKLPTNCIRICLAEWIYRMRIAGVPREAVNVAISAAVFQITSNAELAEYSGHTAGSRTLDKHKKYLSDDGWVLVPRCRGGRGNGIEVVPSIASTPVEFTDVRPRNPRKFCSALAKQTPAEFAPLSEETRATIAPLSDETPAISAPLSPRAPARIESSLREDSYNLEVVSEVKEEGGADAPSPCDALTAFEAYNELAQRCGLPLARTLTPQRRKSIMARMREHGGLDAWNAALANIERSSFLRGDNDRSWRADLDFLLQASRFTKVVEGTYGNGAHAKESRVETTMRLCREIEERLDAKQHNPVKGLLS